jgi:hypothetical protein
MIDGKLDHAFDARAAPPEANRSADRCKNRGTGDQRNRATESHW